MAEMSGSRRLLCAERFEQYGAFRIFDPRCPDWSTAYVDSLEEEKARHPDVEFILLPGDFWEGKSMTDREKAVVMAFTGVTMLAADKFDIFHKYVEEKLGRPVFTHELASKEIQQQIQDSARPDFIALCKEDS